MDKNISLTQKFIKGLLKYNLTFDEITNGKWKYCGGDFGRHLNYYLMCYKDKEIPKHLSECVCGHSIKKNCYITDGDAFIVLGNCCIKKFIPKSSRTCRVCGNQHKNRKDNRCNNCRKKNDTYQCKRCDKILISNYKYCYQCYKIQNTNIYKD